MQNFGKAFPYILLTAVCFGTMEVALKLGGSHFDSIQLTFLRFLIGGVLMIPFAVRDLKKRGHRLSGGDLLYLLLLGIVCVCLSMTVFQIGVMQTNASLAALVISVNPIFTMLFAHFLANERFTPRKLLVLLICLGGLAVAAGPEKLSGGNSLKGILIVLAGAVAFGLYTAMGKRRIAVIGGWAQNCVSFLFGCGALLVYLLAAGHPVFKGITLETIPLLAYLGVVVTGIGYIAFLKAVAVGGASCASVAFFIKPLVAMAAAYLLLDEAITGFMLTGAAMVIAGFIINLLPARSRKAA
ncbi:MAG: DMT family transporter [Oscillospiraceae bacterium]